MSMLLLDLVVDRMLGGCKSFGLCLSGKPSFANDSLRGMARDEKLITDDETTHPDTQAGQTSTKTGKHSSARKPSNTGPDSHSEHKAPVSGAFGNEERRDDPEEQ